MYHFNWHLFCKEVPRVLDSNGFGNYFSILHFSVISRSKCVKMTHGFEDCSIDATGVVQATVVLSLEVYTFLSGRPTI